MFNPSNVTSKIQDQKKTEIATGLKEGIVYKSIYTSEQKSTNKPDVIKLNNKRRKLNTNLKQSHTELKPTTRIKQNTITREQTFTSTLSEETRIKKQLPKYDINGKEFIYTRKFTKQTVRVEEVEVLVLEPDNYTEEYLAKYREAIKFLSEARIAFPGSQKKSKKQINKHKRTLSKSVLPYSDTNKQIKITNDIISVEPKTILNQDKTTPANNRLAEVLYIDKKRDFTRTHTDKTTVYISRTVNHLKLNERSKLVIYNPETTHEQPHWAINI